MTFARRDLTGQRYGMLVALNDIGALPSGRRLWRFACDCGREEDMSPLNVSRADGSGWRACSHCRAKPCKICGSPVITKKAGVTLTCSPECRHANDLLLAREANARRAADPVRLAERAAKQRAWRADPNKRDIHRARSARRIAREAELRAADPAAADRFRESYRAKRARARLQGMMMEGARLKDDE